MVRFRVKGVQVNVLAFQCFNSCMVRFRVPVNWYLRVCPHVSIPVWFDLELLLPSEKK